MPLIYPNAVNSVSLFENHIRDIVIQSETRKDIWERYYNYMDYNNR